MALTPKERADFDEIVLRLRLEDADIGMIQPRHRSFALLVSLIAATLVFGLGVALVGHGVAGPTLIILVLASGAVFGVRSFRRSRSDRNRRRRRRR